MVNDMEAGCPYLIRPTDVLSSPIVLEHVRIETNTPQTLPLEGEEGGFITGTFQKTDEVPAFSAYIIDDPNDINEVKSEELRVKNETWYNLGGQPVALPLKGGGGSRSIFVTKGKAVLK